MGLAIPQCKNAIKSKAMEQTDGSLGSGTPSEVPNSC